MNFFDRLKQETNSERAALYNIPFILDAAQGNITRDTYLAFLGQAYHHVKNTLPIMLLMAGRIPQEKEWVRRLLVEYITEETGHDEWVLGDIKNAGGDAEAVRNSKPSLPVELINAFNYDLVLRQNPLAYFGMIFVLENASTELATQVAEKLQKSLGLDEKCFSYLTSHGSLDIEHVKFIGDALNKITDPKDQEDIIHAAKVIYQLYGDMYRQLPHVSARKAA